MSSSHRLSNCDDDQSKRDWYGRRADQVQLLVSQQTHETLPFSCLLNQALPWLKTAIEGIRGTT